MIIPGRGQLAGAGTLKGLGRCDGLDGLISGPLSGDAAQSLATVTPRLDGQVLPVSGASQPWRP